MTTGLDIPETGLSLRPGEQSGSKPAQVMRLTFAQSTLDEMIANLRKDDPVRIRLGKHASIHYAGKSQSFYAYPETHRSEIYHSSPDKRTYYFSGVMSHSLEVEKAKKATAATDQALANLEESLNAFERGKESKKTHMIQHPDELKALRAATAGSTSHRGPKSKVDLDRDRLLRTAASRSITSSPTLGAPKSPAMPIPTSTPSSKNKTNLRLEAMKTPFIHLLAVRAVSTKFLARQTRSTIEDCATLAQKYGIENRLNREKFDLKDKAYKDLDVWKFPYPTQEDRQEAIENAVSAFDRLRISRTDKLWQTLLPKEERGKGKCLSRLNLRNGPVKKTTSTRAPVDGVDEISREGDTTANETDRRNGSGLASKDLDGTSRSAANTPKSRAEKEPAKRTPKGKSASNTTLTGRITKKTGGKPPAKSESKFKSSEFVHDSDDEDDMPETAPSPKPSPSKQTKPAQPPAKKTQVPAQSRTTTAAASKSKAQTANPKIDPSRATSKNPTSRLSTSPQKPSPLGSSPPTNASDAGRSRSNSQNQSSSSSSSSPLISQLARTNKAVSGTNSRAVRPTPGTTNGASRPVSVSNPLKRKAEPDHVAVPPATGRTTGNLEHKRRRGASTASSGGSTGSASPPLSQELLRQQLWDKSQQFKRFYAKYNALHNKLEAQANPPQADLDKLQKQHTRLHQMKQEIWDEHQRLRDGNLS